MRSSGTERVKFGSSQSCQQFLFLEKNNITAHLQQLHLLPLPFLRKYIAHHMTFRTFCARLACLISLFALFTLCFTSSSSDVQESVQVKESKEVLETQQKDSASAPAAHFHVLQTTSHRSVPTFVHTRRCSWKAIHYRTLDGACNNRRVTSRGAAGRPFKLLYFRKYSAPTGRNRPNARVISNAICSEGVPKRNRRKMSELVTFFGQFLDHNIAKTDKKGEKMPIEVPENDPVFKGGTIPFSRTKKVNTKRGFAAVNMLPSFVDAAGVYGADKKTAHFLRLFKKGKLKMDKHHYLIQNQKGLYLSGDVRVNENPALIAFHTLFMREHNRLCDEILASFPWWHDERVYQTARKIVSAEMQSITYYEFIPAVLGRFVSLYRGYRPWVDPTLSDEFSAVAYRVGHTLINPTLTYMDARKKRRQQKLRDAFFNPKAFAREGMDDIFRGAMFTKAAEVDVEITDEVRNFLLTSPGAEMRLDLASLNIQRGRDHGVPSYNRMRRLYGLRPVKHFYEITRNHLLAKQLYKVYGGDVNKIDAWVGGLAEDHQWPGSLGPLFTRAWLKEFASLRDGDRFYFERWGYFKWNELRKIRSVRRLYDWRYRTETLRYMILANTGLNPRRTPRNVFRTRW